MRGQAGALVKGHQNEFHVVGVSQVQVGDAALFVRDQVLQFGGCACFEDAVHSKVLLFDDDFGIDKAVVGAGAAQRSGRHPEQLAGVHGDVVGVAAQNKGTAALTAQIQGSAVVELRGDGGACAQRKPGDGHLLPELCRAGNGHGREDGPHLRGGEGLVEHKTDSLCGKWSRQFRCGSGVDGLFFIVYPFCRVKSVVITTEYEK